MQKIAFQRPKNSKTSQGACPLNPLDVFSRLYALVSKILEFVFNSEVGNDEV